MHSPHPKFFDNPHLGCTSQYGKKITYYFCFIMTLFPFKILILFTLLRIKVSTSCISHLIPHQAAQGAFAFTCHPAGNAGGTNFAWLSDNQVTGRLFFCIVIQNELWQLGSFPTACCSTNDDHRVILNQRDQLHTHKHKEGLIYMHK